MKFLTDSRAHNDKAWFDANRAHYEAAYVEPTKTATSTKFVDTVLGRWRTFIDVHTWLVANVRR